MLMNLTIFLPNYCNNDSGNETTLVPKMTLNTIIDRAGANVEYYNGSVNIGASGWFSRAANENYMTCGTLKSITYPTGAKDEAALISTPSKTTEASLFPFASNLMVPLLRPIPLKEL